MDAERAERIETKLDDLHRNLVPRREFDRREARLEQRFDRLEEKVDQVLAVQGEHDTRLSVAEAVHQKHRDRKGWMWPSLATIGATILNALLTAVTFLASPHSGSS